MTTTDLQAQLEDVAQSLVMLDPACELSEMAGVRDRLSSLADELRGSGREAAAVAAENAAQIAAGCVAEDRFSGAVVEALTRAIEGLQECMLDGEGAETPPADATEDTPGTTGAGDAAGRDEAAGADADEAAGPDAADVEADAEAEPVPEGLALSSFVEDAIVAEFVSRQADAVADVQSIVLGFDGEVDDDEVASLKRWFHTLKGESGLLGLDMLAELCHVAEDMIQSEPPLACVDRLFEVFDWLQSCFDYLAKKGPVPESTDGLLARLREPANSEPAGGSADPAETATDTATAESAEDSAAADPAAEDAADETIAGEDAADEAIAAEDAADETPDQAEPAADGPAPGAAPEPPTVDLPDYTSKNLLAGDVGLLQDFIAEANEHLDAAEAHLLTIENDPHDEEALNAVFRGFHTIKGLAGFAELDAIQELAHKAENLLDMGRKGDLELTGVYMDLVFESVDTMKRLVEGVTEALATTGHQAEVSELPNLVARLLMATSGESVPAAGGMPAAEASVEPPAAPEPSADSPAADAADAERESPVGKTGFVPLGKLAGQKTEPATAPAADAEAESPVGKTGFVPLGDLARKTAKPAETPVATPAEAPTATSPSSSPDAAAPADAPAAGRSGAPAASSVKVKEAVRVDAERLDRLIETIGEMVIAESMVSQNPEIREKMSVKLAKDLDHLDKISRELQEIGMSLRMVPVRPVFQKMARLVRDLAKKTGRKVEFTMSGEDTELDKNVVDKIGDPLVHMVRNAVDHGLEPAAADRVAAGKPETGHIELRAYHKGGNICIEVVDDGRGLPRDKILRKAIDRGIVKEGDQLSDREVHNLIFEPGFSTAQQVTDISGRGVGMDVVRRNIEELRGTCEIHSREGQGSVFSIKLPLTLAIIEGMVVSCGPEHYIVPTLSVVRLVRLSPDDVFKVFDRGEMMAHEEDHIPLFRLGRLFDIAEAKTDVEEAVVVVVEDEGHKIGVLADDLLGQQSIVIKSLGESMQDTDGVAGGAIMSNGNVALILDVAGLIKVAHHTDTAMTDAVVVAAGDDVAAATAIDETSETDATSATTETDA